jgi:hypothetical protein
MAQVDGRSYVAPVGTVDLPSYRRWTPFSVHDQVMHRMAERIMRRRLEIFVPIVLLAALVQLIAPVGAFRAAAHAVSDPLAMASICSEMTTAERHSMPSHGSDAHGGCCAFCAVAHDGFEVIDPRPLVSASPQRHYQRVVWLEASDVMSGARAGSHAQARAPPVFS